MKKSNLIKITDVQNIEIFLYLLASFLYAIFDNALAFYVVFLYSLVVNFILLNKTKNSFFLIKLLLLSIIIPNNYIIIALLMLFALILRKQIKIKPELIIIVGMYLLINVLNNFHLFNFAFSILYLMPILLSYVFFDSIKDDVHKFDDKITDLIKKIIIIQFFSVIFYFICHLKLATSVIANDWVVGTFGYVQGNILLYFLVFSILYLKENYDKYKNFSNILYIVVALFLIVLTNSIALIIMFIFSYFIVKLFGTKHKLKNLQLLIFTIFSVLLFLIFTPKWSKNYIVNLQKPDYFSKNIPKIHVYADTFINIPLKDVKFLIFGNGAGEFSSRAALTCTGYYIDLYQKIFPTSVSNYTEKYILNRYVEYNLQKKHGTMYSPFSTILSIQGEYGIIGMVIFLFLVFKMFKNSNSNGKVLILFFVLSCFIENYLEFSKIISMLFLIYFICKKNTKNLNERKNLMFIIPTLCGGGAEKTVANLSKYLIKDYNIDIVVFKDTNVKYSYDGNLLILNNKRNTNILKKGIFFFKALYKIRKLKVQRRIDYAISFLTPADILNVLTKVENCKTIISIRNTDSILTGGSILKTITRISCKLCDYIVSISNQVKDDIIDNFGIKKEKITTIYNPSLKIDFSHNQNLDAKLFSNDHTVINVGRLADQKGQWHLIRAFSLVVSEIKDAKLIILGQGPLRDYLQSLIDDYGMKNNITLLGFVDNPYDYMEKADCFAFSSLYEGLGNSLLEAMACNLPIISCDCISGPREILSPNSDYKNKVKNDIDFAEYGILVPICDGKMRSAKESLTLEEKLMAEAIIKMLQDKDLTRKYRELSIERNKDFDIHKIVDEWKLLLEGK